MINCRFCGDPECKHAGNDNPIETCGCYKPVTCADRYFRRATDEELAKLLYDLCLKDKDFDDELLEKCITNDILKWLKRKATE